MELEKKPEYFEPNFLDFNYEDLNIGIKLEVEVLERSLGQAGLYTGEVTIPKKVSIFEGDNGVLTTSYSDITVMELINGGNKESIGIESINIKYNSWYFPEVNIKFVDVRGNAVFNSMEYTNDEERKGDAKGSFLRCLFDFPYPVFKLTVKGYYGKPVTYRLTVKDMRSQFNSNTGNFEINVNFIGYMFSYLTDIPMSLLFIAPYINYDNVSSDLGYFKTGEKQGAIIPTFSDFVKYAADALKKENEDPELKKMYVLLKTQQDTKKITEKIINAYDRLNIILLRYFSISNDDENSGIITLEFKQENDFKTEYNNSGEIAKNIINIINSIKDSWGELKTLVNTETNGDLIITKNNYLSWNSNFTFIDTILKNSTTIKDSFTLYYDYENDVTVCRNINKKSESDIEKIKENIKEKKKDIFADLASWTPTITNIFEMVIKHIDKFHENMMSCIKNIDSNRSERVLSNIRSHDTDCNTHSKNITVYPFPAFYNNENKYVWIGDVPEANNYDEYNFVNKIIEAASTANNNVSNAILDYESMLKSTNIFPSHGIPVLYYDLKYGNEYKNACNGDITKLVSIQTDGDLPSALKILAQRYALWKVYNTNIKFNPKTFGTIEALNMVGMGYNTQSFPKNSLWYSDDADKYYGKFEEEVKKSFSAIYSGKTSNNYPITYSDIKKNTFDVLTDVYYVCEEEEYAYRDYFNNGLVDLTETYNNIMLPSGKELMGQIDDDEYFKIFPSAISNIGICEYVKNIKNKVNTPQFINTNAKINSEQRLNSEEFMKMMVDNPSIDDELAKLIQKKDDKIGLNFEIIDGECSFTNLDWLTDIDDFFPNFDLTEANDENKYTRASLNEKISIKTKKNGKIRKMQTNVCCSFSCKKYWDKGDEEEALQEDEVLKTILKDFWVALGIKSRKETFEATLMDIENSGITKIPKLILLYIGKELVENKETYEMYSNLGIVKKAIEYYNDNWKDITIKIAVLLLTEKSVSDDKNDLVWVTNKRADNSAKKGGVQYFFRILEPDIKAELKKLMNEYEYLFSLHGKPITMLHSNEDSNESRFKITIDEQKKNLTEINDVLKSFITKTREICGLLEDEEVSSSKTEDLPFSSTRKLSIYDTLKNLYDRWKFGAYGMTNNSATAQVSIENFVFRNALNRDISESLTVNLEKIIKLISSIYKGDNDMSVYSFLFEICKNADCLMLSLPVNVFEAINSSAKLKEMFTPLNYISVDDSSIQTTFIVTQRQKDSQHLSFSPNSSSYKDDGIDFNNYVFKVNNESENMGVFGVTYSLSEQRFFKDIQISMDKPKVTEQSISSMLYIAEQGDKNGSNKISRAYHDLFDTYSNHSYHCTISMMGNAQIMPMMYFQLNNIPMFKGGYMIVSAEHTINNQGMTTTFTGNRVNKHEFDLTIDDSYEIGMLSDDDDYGNEGEEKTYKEQLQTLGNKVVKSNTVADNLNYSKEKTKILIDAGHYMAVPGKESPDINDYPDMFPQNFSEKQGDGILNPYDKNGNYEVYRYREYWGTRKIAMRLYEMLKNNGYNVECLFEKDKKAANFSKFTQVANRIYEQQKEKGGSTIIISIHSNAAANEGWGGGNRWEIYKQSSEYVKNGENDEGTRYYALHPDTSHLLAQCIADSAVKVLGELSNSDSYPTVNGKRMSVIRNPQTFENRETKHGIRPTTFCKAPSVLSENLFHDTQSHIKFLADKECREALAKLHYDGIVSFFEKINKR